MLKIPGTSDRWRDLVLVAQSVPVNSSLEKVYIYKGKSCRAGVGQLKLYRISTVSWRLSDPKVEPAAKVGLITGRLGSL